MQNRALNPQFDLDMQYFVFVYYFFHRFTH